ncbi:hypothetical protein K2Q00_02840 [Patescibacteria group bacterium]|nr:hypothetical protein [Patescibacteria group bacterium]
MDKKSTLAQGLVGALVLATTLLPAAALARDGEDSRTTLPVNVSTHIESEGSDDSISADSATTATVRGDNEDKSNDSSGRKLEENDNEIESEIEIDQESAHNASTTIDAPEHVSNRGELRSFLNHVIKADDRISDVRVSSSTIETHYQMPAKFLWTIPMNLTAKVSVDSNGSVNITYPWYAFLFAKHDSDLAAQLEQSAASTGTTTLSASAQAHLLNLLFSNLKTSTGQ